MTQQTYRTLSPLRVGGELVAVGQVVELSPVVAQEWVAAGKLAPLEIRQESRT